MPKTLVKPSDKHFCLSERGSHPVDKPAKIGNLSPGFAELPIAGFYAGLGQNRALSLPLKTRGG